MFALTNNISRISPLVAFLGCVSLGLGVYFYNPKRQINWLFLLFCFDLAIWAFSCLIQSITTAPDLALFADRILYSAAAFTPAILLQLIYAFNGKERAPLVRAVYLAGFLFFALNWSPYFRLGVSNALGARYVTTPFIGWYLFLLYFSGIMFVIYAELFNAFIKAREGDRERQFYLFFSFLVLLAGGACYFVMIVFKFNAFINGFLNILSSLLPASYILMMAALITKYRLMGIRVVISQGTAYGLAAIVYLAAYLLGVFLFAPLNIWMRVFLGAIGFLFACFTFLPFSRYLQTLTSKAFFKDWGGFRVMMGKLAKGLSSSFSR